MILMGQGIGIVIEAWKVGCSVMSLKIFVEKLLKVTKAVDIKLIRAPAGSLLPFKLDVKGIEPFSIICGKIPISCHRQACP